MVRYKRGDPHPSGDGRFFWAYVKNATNGESWITAEFLEIYRQRQNAHVMKNYHKNREKRLEYAREYYKRKKFG